MAQSSTAQSSTAHSPPEPPMIRRVLKIAPEQLLGLALLIGVITAGAVDDLDDALRTAGGVAVIYGFLTVAFRLIGKRELSTLSPLELITLMLIPELASRVITDEKPLLPALVGISMLLLLVFAVSLLSARFRKVEQLVEPGPRVLVRDGELCGDALMRERITPDELFAEMRKHGIADLSHVRWAVLESGGDIAFIPRQGPLPADAPAHRRTM